MHDGSSGSVPPAARCASTSRASTRWSIWRANSSSLKNGFAHLAEARRRAIADGHELARAIRRETEALERLVGEMHAAILQLRMVPVAQVFRSFPRLVRDMSQRLGKKVTLVTRGETTESDKTIVDRLFEPMLHLVRNALDHGIESPEQRAPPESRRRRPHAFRRRGPVIASSSR